MSDHLRGPWTAVLSSYGDVITAAEIPDVETVDISICRGGAVPVMVEGGDGRYVWPEVFSGDDVIELWDDVDVADGEAAIRWKQAQAMTAGLNAAGGDQS